MNWLDRLLGRKPPSAQVAKDRLKFILSYDRAQINPELLERIKNTIVNAISEHVEIDRAGIKITTERGADGDHLVADIPLRGGASPEQVEAAVRAVTEPALPVARTAPPVSAGSRRDYPARKRKRR